MTDIEIGVPEDGHGDGSATVVVETVGTVTGIDVDLDDLYLGARRANKRKAADIGEPRGSYNCPGAGDRIDANKIRTRPEQRAVRVEL